MLGKQRKILGVHFLQHPVVQVIIKSNFCYIYVWQLKHGTDKTDITMKKPTSFLVDPSHILYDEVSHCLYLCANPFVSFVHTLCPKISAYPALLLQTHLIQFVIHGFSMKYCTLHYLNIKLLTVNTKQASKHALSVFLLFAKYGIISIFFIYFYQLYFIFCVWWEINVLYNVSC